MKVKDITLEEVQDIANRYAHCEDRIKHCVNACAKCKYDYTENEIKRVMQFVLKKEGGEKPEKNKNEIIGVTDDREYIQYDGCLYKKIQATISSHLTNVHTMKIAAWKPTKEDKGAEE